MAGIELIREQQIQYGTHGAQAKRDDIYIKLRVGFVKLLSELSDSSRWVFLVVAEHEARIVLNGAQPLNISEIVQDSLLSPRACRYAIADLQARNLLVQVGTREDGSYMYRPGEYAWFGTPRATEPQDSNARSMQNLHTLRVPKRVQKNVQRGAYPPVQNDAPPMQPGAYPDAKKPRKKAKQGVQRGAYPHDDDVLDTKPSEKIVHHDMAAVEKILETVFEGVNVQRLAKILDAKRAQEWVDWIQAPETRKRFRNPAGAAYTALKESPNARPPQFSKPPEPAARRPVIRGKLAALYDNEDTADETE